MWLDVCNVGVVRPHSLDLGLLHHVDVDLVEHIGIVFGLAEAQTGDVHVLFNK